MLQEAELAQQHGEHIQAVRPGQQLVPHEQERPVVLAGYNCVHHLENGALRGGRGQLPDLIGMNGDVFPGMGGNLGNFSQQPGRIRTAGKDQEIRGAFVALLAQIFES